jgi:LacI family transcriptional regulator/LacI family sucrose operon transcriptional repressor
MKITISDVAKRSGVSVATVSRVLNGTAKVNPAKRQSVEEAIRDLGFKPNTIARSLSKKSTNTIGLIVPNIVNPFFNEIAESVEKRGRENNYKIILCNSNNNRVYEAQYLENLMQNQVDAFVIISDNPIDSKVRVPIAYLDRYGVSVNNQHPIIRTDHYQGGRMATEWLIRKGCKKIAYLGKEKLHKDKTERIDGYLDVMDENGLKTFCQFIEYDYISGVEGAKNMLSHASELDGIFAGNDLIAYAVIKECFKRNIQIPEEIQLIGYDNILFSELITPSLTTIAQPIAALGEKAVDVIVDILNGKKQVETNIVLHASLVERDTTK